jgi:hypothetical protein
MVYFLRDFAESITWGMVQKLGNFTLRTAMKVQRWRGGTALSLTSVLDGDVWPGTHYVRDCVGPTADLDRCGMFLPPPPSQPEYPTLRGN